MVIIEITLQILPPPLTPTQKKTHEPLLIREFVCPNEQQQQQKTWISKTIDQTGS